MIVYSTGKSTYSHSFIPKSADGYKIPSPYSIKRLSTKMDNYTSFEVYNVLNTSDFYVLGLTVLEGRDVDIVDSNNREISKLIDIVGGTDIKHVLFFSFVDDLTDEYFILINGEKHHSLTT